MNHVDMEKCSFIHNIDPSNFRKKKCTRYYCNNKMLCKDLHFDVEQVEPRCYLIKSSINQKY